MSARRHKSGCPICGQPVVKAYRPFCSRRCADADLGRWFSGAYAVPGEPVDPADLPPAPQEGTERD
ncbi:DNA gyrase inhibitor YacG [Alkalicaulis satelles]|uniref:DNA gyrase inhibitor YacG n=1 Tax=Alkalicaulis satelles TaxID=2609175 RepID=A0A5M6ZLX5_9PROT|nr:DNA gyrase inhibitor YacG [Alkalicaulis satelles]KAA5804687.1 DNA gyrase inhibitor YacG [Alkalicaulis satelles]